MNRNSPKIAHRKAQMDNLIPYIYTAVSLYEAVLDLLQVGWARNVIKPLLAITLVIYYHVKTQESSSNFRQYAFYGLFALFLSEGLAIFPQDNEGIQLLNRMVSAVGFVLLAVTFTWNIIEGKIDTGIPFVAAFAAPYLIFGTIVFFVVKGKLAHGQILTFIYLVAMLAMGIQSAVRNHNTNAKSFKYTAAGAAALVFCECLLLILQARGLKIGLIRAFAIFGKSLGAFGIMKGCVEHVEYFDIQKKELMGRSLFGGVRGQRIERPKTM